MIELERRLNKNTRDSISDSEDEDDLERENRDNSYDSEATGDESELEDLTRTKLKRADYLKRAQSAKTKKRGKYGVTVPIPFKGTLGDTIRPKSIRAKKVDAMVEAKRQEEEIACRS